MEQQKTFLEQANDAHRDYIQGKAEELYQQRIEHISRFIEANPDHPYSIANQHVTRLAKTSSWNAFGLLSVSGLGWWALNLSVDLTSFKEAVIFNASGGPDWSIALFTSSVAGAFYVDPSTLVGKYDFKLQSVAAGAGEVSFDLFDKNGMEIASFFGAVVGASVSKMKGTGTLSYKHT